jgi:hypothetical protein
MKFFTKDNRGFIGSISASCLGAYGYEVYGE